jgi:hypothetical protein
VGQHNLVLPSSVQDVDVYLWQPLLKVKPSWHRGAQGIGDCVSWGGELACTMSIALQCVQGKAQWIEEVATESIYGGRAEMGDASWQDGWDGHGLVEWLQAYGVVFRIDYTSKTNNPETDMRVYSADKAKNWGYYGNGGKKDGHGGPFDLIAKDHSIKYVKNVGALSELDSSLIAGKPVIICSNVGFEGMERDSNGVVRRNGHWGHCMMIAGRKRIDSSTRGYRIFQSWGDSASGPDPGIENKAISNCSWWAIEQDVQQILEQGDSWSISDIDGFEPSRLDLIGSASTWN